MNIRLANILKDNIGVTSSYTFPIANVVDVEVTVQRTFDGEWEAAPRNLGAARDIPRILQLGIHEISALAENTHIFVNPSDDFDNALLFYLSDTASRIIVGHNIGFDYQHIYCALSRRGRPPDWLLVWDTMIGAYVLSGQASKFASLGSLMQSELGLPPKPDFIGTNLAAGVAPQDIPPHELRAYLRDDVLNTAAVFKKQWDHAKEHERRLIMMLSLANLAYAQCSHNGLRLDQATAIARRDKCFHEVERMAKGFKEVWTIGNPGKEADIETIGLKVKPDGPQWAVTPTAMSSLLYGQPATIHIGSVRNTSVKGIPWRQIQLVSPLAHVTCPIEKPPAQAGRKMLSTADEHLKAFAEKGVEPHASLARMEQHRRHHHKLGTTYYQALIEQAHNYNGRIHPKIHATSTNTGRTSSSSPNIQNQPPETREVFIPDTDQQFAEFDFQQLEIWALAIVSGCPQLTSALQTGDDIHYLTGVEAGLWATPAEMTKEGRRLVKRVNFGLIYGGGARTLAEQSGAPLPLVRKIIKSFYARFVGVGDYHKALINYVQYGGPAPSDFFTCRREIPRYGEGGTVTDIMITTATGRSYLFQEERPGEGVSVTKIKNYFVQGFGTGDVVQMTLAFLFLMIPNEWWRAVVHDAALYSLKAEEASVLETAVGIAQGHTIALLRDEFGIDVAHIPLNTTFEYKNRWSPMEKEVITEVEASA